MKIGIVAANNIRYSPYIFFYTSILDKYHIDYELIYPNRSKIKDDFSGVSHILPWNEKKPVLLEYIEYAKAVKKVVDDMQYDFLIVLTTNNAVFLSPWLKKKYRNKYIVDIRDYTHENIWPYYFFESMAIKYSAANIISSDKFLLFLPKGKYCICHNLPKKQCNDCSVDIHKRERIVIGYIGKGGYLSQCENLCKLISEDPRFEMHIYGLDYIPEQLHSYNKNSNIRFFGTFSPEEKPSILSSIDILFNVYGNGSPLLDYALSNKLYDSLVYNKPILTSPNTYMSESAGPLSFDVDFGNADLLNDLYKWYNSLDFKTTKEYATKYLHKAQEQNCCTEKIIMDKIDNYIR